MSEEPRFEVERSRPDELDRLWRERAEGAERARRASWSGFFLGIGTVAASAFVLWVLQPAASRAPRGEDAESLARAIREALAVGGAQGKLAELSARADALEKSLEEERSAREADANDLARTRTELAAAREKLREYEKRYVEEDKGIDRFLALVGSKRAPAANPAGPESSGPASLPADGLPADANISVGAVAPPGPPPLDPFGEASLRELNALLEYATESNLSIVDAAGHAGPELRDVVFARRDARGRAAGLLQAKRVAFEESASEPRLRMQLLEGVEVVGKNRVPFGARMVPFRNLHPAEFRRRMPELYGGSTAASQPAAAVPPPDPHVRAVVARVNALFAAHPDYERLRLDDVAAVEADHLYGVQVSKLSAGPSGTAPRILQTLRARRLSIVYHASDRRLELVLEDGTRSSGSREVPFPGNAARLLLPGVERVEVEGGNPPLPVQIR